MLCVRLITLTGTMVGLAYGTEFFIAWYSGTHMKDMHSLTVHLDLIGGLIGQ
jgi:hypothetical protein